MEIPMNADSTKTCKRAATPTHESDIDVVVGVLIAAARKQSDTVIEHSQQLFACRMPMGNFSERSVS